MNFRNYTSAYTDENIYLTLIYIPYHE